LVTRRFAENKLILENSNEYGYLLMNFNDPNGSDWCEKFAGFF
jgi:hypothetical protein